MCAFSAPSSQLQNNIHAVRGVFAQLLLLRGWGDSWVMREHRNAGAGFKYSHGGEKRLKRDGVSTIRHHARNAELWMQEYRKDGFSPGSRPL
jgi:hypothetical protein